MAFSKNLNQAWSFLVIRRLFEKTYVFVISFNKRDKENHFVHFIVAKHYIDENSLACEKTRYNMFLTEILRSDLWLSGNTKTSNNRQALSIVRRQ